MNTPRSQENHGEALDDLLHEFHAQVWHAAQIPRNDTERNERAAEKTRDIKRRIRALLSSAPSHRAAVVTEVQRYRTDFTSDGASTAAVMREDARGNWVRHSDHEKALAAALGGGEGWIACSERMPEATRDVLVHGRDGDVLVACLKSDGSWEQNTNWCSGRGDDFDDRMWETGFVTHWMPLPKPPHPDQAKGEVRS